MGGGGGSRKKKKKKKPLQTLALAQRHHLKENKSWGTKKMRKFRGPAKKDGEAARNPEAAAEREG